MIVGQEVTPTPFRLPVEIKKLLKHTAIDNCWSLNAEVVQRLKASSQAEGKQV